MIWEQRLLFYLHKDPECLRRVSCNSHYIITVLRPKEKRMFLADPENCQNNQGSDKAKGFRNDDRLICNVFVRVRAHVLAWVFKNRPSTWNCVSYCTGYILFTFLRTFSTFIHAPSRVLPQIGNLAIWSVHSCLLWGALWFYLWWSRAVHCPVLGPKLS